MSAKTFAVCLQYKIRLKQITNNDARHNIDATIEIDWCKMI